MRSIVVQLFVAVTAMIVLMLAFGVSERSTLTTQLRESRSEAASRAELLDAVTAVLVDGLLVIDDEDIVVVTVNLDGSALPAQELPRSCPGPAP